MFFSIITVSLILCYLYFKWCFNSAKRRGIPYVPPTFPSGSSQDFLLRKQHIAMTMTDLYNNLKSGNHKLGAFYMFNAIAFMPLHADVIRKILCNDFQHFVNHAVYWNEDDDPLSAHLFALEGRNWKAMRTKLTPTFTSGKMKMMYPLLVRCGEKLVECLESNYREGKATVDIKDYFSRFTTDVIGSCAFGLDCNSFQEEDGHFRKMGDALFKADLLPTIKKGLSIAFPSLPKIFKWTFTPKEAEQFFMAIIRDTLKFRRERHVVRNDFLQLLIDIQDKDGLTFEEMCAQSFVFFVAGFETSSTLMGNCLYELAKNPEMQDKIRSEIKEALRGSDVISYETLHELKYLGCVLEETLRKYPPVPFLTRRCTKDWIDNESGIKINKSELVFIPIYGLHHDPELFPEPEKFDPSRFSVENKGRILSYSYLPFGEGPRLCIGLRFGMMQSRLGIGTLIKKFKFALNTFSKEPLELRKETIIVQSKDPIILNVESI